MAKSAAFARIKAGVFAITKAIPAGKVTSFKAIGAHLDVMPRHVAYILATLTNEEKVEIPWQRVVGDRGKLERVYSNPDGVTQAELLTAEGISLVGMQIQGFDDVFFIVNEATTGVLPIQRDSAR